MRHPTTTSFAAVAALVLAAAPSGAQVSASYPAAADGGNYMHNYYIPPAPSSTPWHPEWRPDGRAVTVGMSGSIWDVDPVSGVATELTYGPGYHSSPAWSPDGRWLVYTADESGERVQLRAMDVRSGEDRALTDDDQIYLDPTFSPSGNRLAYVATLPDGHFNVFIRPIRDGRWTGPAQAVTSDRRYPRNRLYFGPWDMHITPTWTPDGEHLLLVSNRDQALGSGWVWRVPARAGGMEEAEPVLREQTLFRPRPDVSHDGQRFVYSSTSGTADQFNNLYVQPTVGGTPYKLTFFGHDAFHPRWSPDGEWIAYVDNREGLPQLALLETYGGANRLVKVTERRWKRPMGRLRVRVVDGPVGAPTEARIHLLASDGKTYAPSDAYARIGRMGDHAFHVDGGFEVEVPPGATRVVGVKGFARLPDTATVNVEAGRTTNVTLTLTPLVDLAGQGWYSGSTHVHMNYAGNLHNTPGNMLFMSAAEDQDVVVDLVANKDNRILDRQYFIPGGGPLPSSPPRRPMVVGEEYRPPFYGHVFMIGLTSHLISPFVTGYDDTGIASLYPTNTDMMRKAQAQGAFTGYVHPYAGDRDPIEGDLGGGKGFLADVALGTADALEWSYAERAGFYPLYAAWNNGFHTVATGGEDAISSLHSTPFVGSHRTYVRTPDGRLTWAGWMAGLRAGHAFVSNGPLLTVDVDGKGPGESLELPAGGGRVTLRADVHSIAPLRRLLVVHDGEVVDSMDLVGSGSHARFEGSYTVRESGWLHVRVSGEPEDRGPLDTGYPQAFTNPVWVSVGGAPVRSRASADYAVRWVERLRELADAWPWWRSESERAHLHRQLDAARAEFRRRGDEERSEGTTGGR